jgi:hypothetical protein
MPYIDVLPSQTVWEYNLRGKGANSRFHCADKCAQAPDFLVIIWLQWFIEHIEIGPFGKAKSQTSMVTGMLTLSAFSAQTENVPV